MRVLPDDSAVFNASGPSGRSLLPETLSLIEIQARTNLRDWTTLTGACTLTNGTLVVRDPDCAQFGQRFYRVVER